MDRNERELFRYLCNLRTEDYDDELLKYASAEVLGELFINRMQGVAYYILKRRQQLSKVTREFRNSLEIAYENNVRKNEGYLKCLKFLNEVLDGSDYKYAMLKGAYLCWYYPEGCRTSNDIDLLVKPEDVTKIGDKLYNAGFRQGKIVNGEFIPATRKEIIEAKMTRGETVPYIIEVSLPHMKYLEVDINFSLDYKNGEGKILDEMLDRSCVVNCGDFCIRALDQYDFFIHLCSHLYKEVATMPWVEMRRDMTLYKYCDIYLLLEDMSKQDFYLLWKRAKELGVEKICSFAMLQTSKLFAINKPYIMETIQTTLERDPMFVHRVIAPSEKKIYVYEEKDLVERFFSKNRKELLREVRENV